MRRRRQAREAKGSRVPERAQQAGEGRWTLTRKVAQVPSVGVSPASLEVFFFRSLFVFIFIFLPSLPAPWRHTLTHAVLGYAQSHGVMHGHTMAMGVHARIRRV